MSQAFLMTWTTALNIMAGNVPEDIYHDQIDGAERIVIQELSEYLECDFDDPNLHRWVTEGDYTGMETVDQLGDDYDMFMKGGGFDA